MDSAEVLTCQGGSRLGRKLDEDSGGGGGASPPALPPRPPPRPRVTAHPPSPIHLKSNSEFTYTCTHCSLAYFCLVLIQTHLLEHFSSYCLIYFVQSCRQVAYWNRTSDLTYSTRLNIYKYRYFYIAACSRAFVKVSRELFEQRVLKEIFFKWYVFSLSIVGLPLPNVQSKMVCAQVRSMFAVKEPT